MRSGIETRSRSAATLQATRLRPRRERAPRRQGPPRRPVRRRRRRRRYGRRRFPFSSTSRSEAARSVSAGVAAADDWSDWSSGGCWPGLRDEQGSIKWIGAERAGGAEAERERESESLPRLLPTQR